MTHARGITARVFNHLVKTFEAAARAGDTRTMDAVNARLADVNARFVWSEDDRRSFVQTLAKEESHA